VITEDFSERTVAHMETALERACGKYPKLLSTHEARKTIAIKILERALRGERSLEGLTDAAVMAAAALLDGTKRSHRVAKVMFTCA
jgi:hypothetical protein